MPLSAHERTERSKKAAAARWAKHDPTTGTAKARAAFDRRFLDEVDPDRTLADEESASLAKEARREHFRRLGQASARARRAKAATS